MTDINECAASSSLCHYLANCHNTAGGYNCICHPGLELASNNYDCIGIVINIMTARHIKVLFYQILMYIRVVGAYEISRLDHAHNVFIIVFSATCTGNT